MKYKPLLKLIGKHESRNNYNIVWGRIAKKDHPPRPLTQMTIGEVLAWQDSIDPHYMSEAAGYYQILEDTLRGLYREAGLSANSLYSPKNQDRLAVQLLKRRGLDEWEAGRMSTPKFANSLAKEWASLPVVSGPKTGRSYYAGDGLNKALTSPEQVFKALDAIRDRNNETFPLPDWLHRLLDWFKNLWR